MLRVETDDGSFFFVPESRRLAVQIGTDLQEDERDGLALLGQVELAKDQALRLLARAANSRWDLRRKLGARGHDEEAIGRALNELADAGLLDDERFALAWVRSTLRRKAASDAALEAGLRRRGIAADLAARVVAEVVVDEQAELTERLERAAAAMKGDYRRIASRLLSRGFPPSLVRAYLDRRFRAE